MSTQRIWKYVFRRTNEVNLKQWIRWVVLIALMCTSTVAGAQVVDDDEIIVYGDRFKRWDKTRWAIHTEVQLPQPMWLRKALQDEMRISAYQMRVILACEKDWKISRGKWEILCEIERMGFQVVAWRGDQKRLERNDSILKEIHSRMEGKKLQLQVTKNGRVSNIDLEGLDSRNSKERSINETCRQLLMRMVAGFDMKLRRNNFLKTGQWVEYRSPLFDMPGASRANMGGALVVHQLDPYKGHIVVQSVGKGSVAIDGEADLSYAMNMEGVSIYQLEGGFMTDRVWFVTGAPTGNFWSQTRYFSAGRLEMLAEKQVVDVGAVRQVFMNPTKIKLEGSDVEVEMPVWKSIEETGDWQRPRAPKLPPKD